MADLISVILKDGTCCLTAPKGLDVMIHANLVYQFCRSEGWVNAGATPARAKPAIICLPETDNHEAFPRPG